ncbi:MAG: SDR family NAD(P)-dependent oxidoreductase, partial [Verrucomicrobiota bacterium]
MLRNKIVLVTGASSGIGRAVAMICAREGARIVVSDIQQKGGLETVALVREFG